VGPPALRRDATRESRYAAASEGRPAFFYPWARGYHVFRDLIALRRRSRCNLRAFFGRSLSLGRSFHNRTCAIPAPDCMLAREKPTIRLMLLAERLVGEARTRRAREMDEREWVVLGTSAALFIAVGIAMVVLLPQAQPMRPALAAALVLGYAALTRVRFEFGESYVCPEELVLLPMLMLLPAGYVPLLVAGGAVLSILPECVGKAWHPHRWVTGIADSWLAVGPALILGLFLSHPPTLDDAGLFGLAFIALLAGDFGWSTVRNALLTRVPFRAHTRSHLASTLGPATFSSLGFVVGLAAVQHVLVLAVVAPLVWLLHLFSRDRHERYSATLELNRAYRGTVMLLADVLEFEDGYTADHSRSVVELVRAVAEELRLDQDLLQELEFAALLHDVGKISIPKEILHKPSKLTDSEFEVVKTHTIEGQFMLDRVGGLLGRVGEIVRSCHERWDGRGYPDGLVGEGIPLPARIVFACDAYNAMTTDRPYRPAMAREAAVAELEQNVGTQFDPTVVPALIRVVEAGEPAVRAADQVRAVLAGLPTGEHAPRTAA
jgi:HD-GYP domain-containing protein (c-di-GMP phosphodiesterase class II)